MEEMLLLFSLQVGAETTTGKREKPTGKPQAAVREEGVGRGI